jgi:FMN-dependent NADH-azoreductase
MKHILHLISSIHGEESYSIRLGKNIIEKIQQKYPGSTLEEINLVELNVPHLNEATFQSFLIPGEQLTAEQKESISFSDNALKQLMAADIIVIGAPFYNFSVPSVLKAWIDHITRPGVTFKYGESGPMGMVIGKKVYVAMSSGGVYSAGPIQGNDFLVPYLKMFLGFLGMTDLTVFRAEGVKVPGIMEHALEKAVESVEID